MRDIIDMYHYSPMMLFGLSMLTLAVAGHLGTTIFMVFEMISSKRRKRHDSGR